jgi:tetratricopeptide (TPR) repeat protein
VTRADKSKYAVAAAVALLTAIVYLAVLGNGFVQRDDGPYIFANPHIRSFDAAFLKWAFLSFHQSNWHPLTWIFHAFDYALWGLTPLGHHLTSVILHVINTGIVFFLAIGLLEESQASRREGVLSPVLSGRLILIAAGATGLLFGLHPLHVESVAWAAEKKDLLCALFYLLSVVMYINAVKRVGHGAESGRLPLSSLLSALCFFILALLSKPMAVSLPAVLLILDWYPFGRIHDMRTFRVALVEKLPFIVLSLASSVLTVLAQQSGGAMALTSAVPLPKRLLVAAESLNLYLVKMIWPLDLLPFYPYPKDISFWSLKYMAAIGSLIGITAACLVLAKKQKWWLAVLGYYVVSLAPVIGIVQVGGQAMADRYAYLPGIGPFLIMGATVAWLWKKAGTFAELHGRSVKAALAVVALFIFFSLCFLTFRQIGIWKSDLDLWTYVIKKEPGTNQLAYSSRGMLFFEKGLFEEAIADFTQIINLDASSYPAYLYRGMALYNTGRLDRAIDNFDKAISLNPNSVKAYMNRGMAFNDKGLLDRAIEDFGRVVSLDPSNYTAYNNLGALYGKQGKSDKAVAAFSMAIASAPDRGESYYNRGLAYVSLKQNVRALEDFSRALDLNQNDAAAYYSRGRVRLITGQKWPASEDFQKACALGYADGCDMLHRLSAR